MAGASLPQRGLASLLVLLLPLLHTVRANVDAPCYDPSGTVAPGYYPCDPTAFITNCCANGWTCFSNSLCVVTEQSNAFPNLTQGAVNRAMCTNPKWNNQICGDFCITGDDNTDGQMVACGDDRFCCLGDYNNGACNCSSSGNNFVVNDGKAQTVVGETAQFTAATVSYLTSQPTPSPTTASTTTTSGASSSSTTTTGTSGTSSATGPANTSTNGTDASGGTSNNNSKHALAVGLGAGLGVGIPVVAAILGALYYFFLGPGRRGGRGGGRRRNTFGGGSGRVPTDLALDGSAFGAQMAMQGNAYRRGENLGNVGGGGAAFNDFGEVPPPPPQVRRGVD